MPHALMDEAELKQWLLRRLGAPFIQVELCDDNLVDVIEFSRRWFSAKKGVKKQMMLPFYSGQPDYVLPDTIDTVFDVSFPAPQMDISLVFSPFILVDDKVPYDVFAAPGSAGIYSSYTQTLQYIEMAKRTLNADANWRQEDRTLFIFPVPKTNGSILVDYKSSDFTIEQLNQRDHDLVKRYALAKAKLDVGRIRSKYDQLPGAQGSIGLDGVRLLQEGEQEIEKLEVEIAQSAYPIGFIHG